MRKFGLSAAVLCCLSVTAPGLIQKATGDTQKVASDALTADQTDVGNVQTRILKYEHALGIVVQLARPHGANVECNAVCYLPSSSKTIAWKCDPARKCDVQCTVNPPVGVCD
jgi:hypothetical protein